TLAPFWISVRNPSLSPVRAASTSGGLLPGAAISRRASPIVMKRYMALDPRQRIDQKFSVAAADTIDWKIHLVHQRHEQVRHGWFARILNMPATLEPAGASAHHEKRQTVARMLRAVGNAGAVQDRHMIQQRAIAVGRRAKFRQILREQLRVIAVDLRHLRNQLR